MKKLISMALILVLIFSVAACSKAEPEPVETPKQKVFLPNFDAEKSAKMGAFMNHGMFLMTDEYFFGAYTEGFDWRNDHKTADDGTITVVPAADQKKVDIPELADAEYLCEGPDDAVYLLDQTGRIIRLAIGSRDFKVIADAEADFLSIANDKLYYTKGEDSRFYSANLDGSNETLVLDKEAYYTYVVDNFLIYQDDDDNESIYLYNMDTKEDVKLLEGPAYSPNIVGNYLYCYKEDSAVGFSKFIVGEFKETGFEPFADDVLNRNNRGWFNELNGPFYMMSENAGLLYFTGQNVYNFGDSDQGLMEIDGVEMWATIPAYHLSEKSLNFGDATFIGYYSSPYGRVYKQYESDTATIDYFKSYTNFEGGFYAPGSNVEKVAGELAASANG